MNSTSFQNRWLMKVSTWSTPRLLFIHSGHIFFQVGTCYPCPVCQSREQTVEKALRNIGINYSRIVHGKSLFYVAPVVDDKYGALSVTNQVSGSANIQLMKHIFGLSFTVDRTLGSEEDVSEIIQLWQQNLQQGQKSQPHDQPQMLLWSERLKELQKQAALDPVLKTSKILNNRYLLVACLVLEDGNIEQSIVGLRNHLDSIYNKSESFADGIHSGWGGPEARTVHQELGIIDRHVEWLLITRTPAPTNSMFYNPGTAGLSLKVKTVYYILEMPIST